MLGAICGDIIGSVFERNNYKAKDIELFSPKTTFTDDTLLTLAIADSLVHGESYAANLRKYYRLYPDAGFGRSFRNWANSEAQNGYNSFGNGSAMRVSPVGWAFDALEDVIREAEATAMITHNHPEGIKGAKVVAGAVFIARTGGRKSDIKDFAESQGYDVSFTLDDIRETYEFDVSCQGSVPQALVAFLESTDFEDAIRGAISIGGDSDTISCIAAGIAESFYGDIPSHIKDPCLALLDESFLDVVEGFRAKFMGEGP